MVDLCHQEVSNGAVSADHQATFCEIARWTGVVALFVSLILAYAWSHNEILQINYQKERLKKENEELREINSALRAEHSSLINPETIYREARERGLVNSNRAEIRIIDVTRPLVQPLENLVAQTLPQKNTLHE